MKTSSTITLFSALMALVSAVPLNRRNAEYVTERRTVVKTDWVVQTVWVLPDGSPYVNTSPAAAATMSSYVASVPSVGDVSEAKAAAVSTPSPAAPAPAQTSAPLAPTTSAIAAAAPAPTSAAPSTSSSSGSTSAGMAAAGTSYTGDITYYGTGLGSCGWTSGYNDHIVAISHIIMDAYSDSGNPNTNPLCGKMVSIKYNGQSFPAKVVDRCVGCAEGDLDLSEGFFSTVTNGDTAAGRIPGVQWSWMD